MVASGSRRRVGWFVFLVAFALLPFAPLSPFTAPAYADPPVFDGKEIKDLCTISASGQDCPVFPPPPPLLNPGAVAAAGTDIADSLRRLQDQAVDNTLADHGLPASDRDAVLSWARDDTEAELWALIVEAITTSESERTPDQQHAAEWMLKLASAQSVDSAKYAGAEYATWAGLDVKEYWRIAGTATEAELTTFLSEDVRTFSPLFTPRGGYCRYTPPDPYSDDYDGSDTPTCFTSCPSVAGCPIPTPTKDDFVSWGQAAASTATLSDTNVQAQAAKIAKASMYATVGVAAAVVLGTALTAMLSSTAAMTAIFTTLTTAGEVVGGAAIGTLAGAAAIAGAVLIVLVAIVTAVLEAIRVFGNAALPGQVAQYVVNARSTVTDPTTLIGTTDGATSLFNMFVGATLPRPRYDVACDNSLIPPWAYTASFDPNLLVYVPLGENRAITMPVSREGCLNPPPVPPAAPTDAHFLVQAGGVGTPQVRQSIDIGADPAGTTQKVRLSNNWFVATITQGSSSRTWQQLTLDYYDWDGVGNVAWLVRDDDGSQRFIGAVAPDGTIDPDTCLDDGSCWESDHIDYVGTDGQRYLATIEQPASATGQPTYSPSDPVEASPVTFDAADFEPPSSDHHVDYSWRFQNLGCGFIECLSGPQTPSYDGPFTGKTVSYAWDSIGAAKVELTATDQHGHSATTVFVVNVGNVAPTALALHENSTTVGTELTLQGVVSDVGADDDLNVEINFGDGTKKATKVGPNSIPLLDPDITRLRLGSEARWSILAKHTYAEPGIYYGSYTVSDWGGGTDFDTFRVLVTGAQKITFAAVEDQTYGDHVEMAATGTQSGRPVTYTAGPAGVCAPSGENGAEIKLVGVGECTVTAHQAEYLPVFLVAPDVGQSFDVAPADLTITADDKTRVYGADAPSHTASFDGLVNGDTADDFPGLVITGPPTDADAGGHDITVSGATSPNYDIEFVTGTETITPAPLTITADDKTKVYGAEDPDFTASYDGLVNGDEASDLTGLVVTGAPTGADVGDYDITPSGSTNLNYDVDYVTGTETITAAPLNITADDQTQVYGGEDPAYTASFDGLVNGDTKSEFSGLSFAGPPSGSDVGDYDITPSGATNPNYDIDYALGTQTVIPAPLTITADDKTKVYGAEDPDFTASYDGLVNGDGKADISGLVITGAPIGADVGVYDITPSGASNPNYDIDFATGTEKITPASLTIRPADTAVNSGLLPTYSWTGDGWVNGDSDATLSTPPSSPPTCRATVGGVPLSSGTAPGDYADAITCSGADDANYDIDYATADLRVDPVISLAQQGLPSSVSRRATLDGLTLTLPVVSRGVRLGTRHSYSFPKVVLDAAGTTYVTSVASFDGVVNDNVNVTATYRTMRQVLQLAQNAGGITRREADKLDRTWEDIQTRIKRGRNARAEDALFQFADRVRKDTGSGLSQATAQDLLAYAQAVYQHIGGTGTL